MGRITKKGRSRQVGSFTMLPHDLIDSEAFASLKPAEVSVLLRLMRIYNGRNNGHIAASVRQLADWCNINKDTAAKALSALVAFGFIELAQESAFHFKLRRAAEYRLTCHKCDRTGAHPTRGWKKVEGEKAQVREQEPLAHG